MAPTFDAIQKKSADFGVVTYGAAWLNRSVVLKGPASSLSSMVALPEVTHASLNDGKPIELADQDKCYASLPGNTWGIDGQSWRVGTRDSLLSINYSGDTGGRAGSRERVAVLDSGFAVRAHHAFRFAASSPPGDRFLVTKFCSSTSCTTTSDPGGLNHANAVTHWAVGNVESGRDPNCSWLMGDIRSGSRASGAHILAYDVFSGCAAGRLGIQDAVAQGADIVNMSVGYAQTVPCDSTYDCGGLNSAIRSATDQGVLIVGGAGNKPWPGACNVVYPNTRPEVLTVGGVNTQNRTTDFNSTVLHGESSGGAMLIHMATGTWGYDTVVDLVGPYVVNFTGATSPDWYANSANTVFTGTSVASPAVAGSAARVLDGFRSIGWPENARTLRLNLLLMGDAADGATQDRLFGASYTWGYGRPHVTVPAAGWAAGPSWWGQSPFTLQPGVTAYGCVNGCQPMPSSVRQYNWVLFYEDADLTWTPYVGIQIKDLDTGQVIRQDISHSQTKRIQLRDGEIWGRRLQLVVIPYQMWGSYTMYSGDFFHSDSAGWTYH
ncbi:MAG: S8/S53 family peptidase [Polyangiaceae bacterium]